MHFVQIPSAHRAMPISIRDVVTPPNEVQSTVKATQIGTYVTLIPAAIIVYDTRASYTSDRVVFFSDVVPVCTLDKEVCYQISALRL